MKHTEMGRQGMHGLTLRDLRSFARQTEDWPEDTYLDCYIPSEDPGKHTPAPLMGLEASENINCPRCGAPLHGEPVNHSLSRVDNTTRICSGCGTAEAMWNHAHPDQPMPPVNQRIQVMIR